jgi:glycosyltransferase involved in cell wall biosynthesis
MFLTEPIKVTDQKWPENTQPIVSIFSWVYNHKDYVRESIESILMQKTSFPIEIIIHDDASNDGTKEIIFEYQEKYPNLFSNILQQQNQWSQGKSVMIPLFEKPRGKYLALMHGDDYWIDEFKLQKQFEMLNSNKSILYCGACVQIIKDNFATNILVGNYKDLTNYSIINSFKFFKLTSLLIDFSEFKIISNKYPFKENMTENLLNLILFENGKGIYYSNIVSIYRITGEGVWSKLSKIKKMNIHYIEIKYARKCLKKNWSFHALQEIVCFSYLAFKSPFEKNPNNFINNNIKDFIIVCVLFLIKLGFIKCIPNLVQWLKVRKETGIGI